jgi:hypothetical protein
MGRQAAADCENVRRGCHVGSSYRSRLGCWHAQAVVTQSLECRDGELVLGARAAVDRALAQASLARELVEIGGHDHAFGGAVLAHKHDSWIRDLIALTGDTG